MPKKSALTGLIVICLTILCFTWMVRGSLCELQIKNGSAVIQATLAYEAE
ncbi:Hok/Gef family protein [Aliivibrio salmonicida]|uniref:Hok/Gef family protein n=1 Tax=Aliivibrio fischeri TaxID=668 RepID=A0A844P5Z8_ALIFS|nr:MULTISPECIES: Hok/Gef family protein [Aliivibrio]AZL83634.1 Hok/Gef family protein [Aliivibrio salmonicida]MCP3699355.1 Hok/Gef family protein [Aliivibrio sp.]MUK51422.1 Hok/Gef family protein [Aliivibrio fischeri]